MPKQWIAAFDQGTTSSRTVLFDRKGGAVAKGQVEFRQLYPRPGWVEHDPRDIFESQLASWRAALAAAGGSAGDVAAIGIANQRETVLVWDRKTGEPIYNAIVWQCRRTAQDCERLKSECGDLIYQKTGLFVDAYFSASKIAWLLGNVPDARRRAERGELLFGTVDCYLIWKLTGGRVHATDRTNASRTMLFNIDTLDWDDDLCRLFGVPKCMLPKVLPSGAEYGVSSARLLGAEIPICAAVGDQQGALFGQHCTGAGDVKNTYGTGCFLLMNTGKRMIRSRHGMLTTLTATLGEVGYALEGSVFVGGAVVQWLRDEMGLISDASETEKLAFSVADTGGVTFVPAFVGLGAPYWDPDCRGSILGITRGTSKAQVVRAALESIALQTADVVRAMQPDAGEAIESLRVDGGASANAFLMQFQADVLGVPVLRPKVIETTALGAASLAGLYCGFYPSESVLAGKNEVSRFEPRIDAHARGEIVRRWEHALDCARSYHNGSITHFGANERKL